MKTKEEIQLEICDAIQNADNESIELDDFTLGQLTDYCYDLQPQPLDTKALEEKFFAECVTNKGDYDLEVNLLPESMWNWILTNVINRK